MSGKKKSDESVRVVVRCRPMSKKEIADNHRSITALHTKRGVIDIKNPNKGPTEPPKSFTFDAIYDENSKQMDLYDETFRDLVDSVLSGFNGTIFAYGQTGTGKTFTMQGEKDNQELRGVIPNSFEHVFSHIARSEDQQYLVRASYLEIYQEEIRDLLAKDQSKRLELKERPDTGVYVKDLSSFVTKSVKEIEHVMHVGNQNRSVGATNMNEHSSRSHAIFVITVECSETSSLDGENHIRVGKLNMVDLAGSERQSKTGSTGDRFKEATKINLSLSALGNVISALVDGKTSHIPYRDSKLTRLLQDSLGGNAKTIMVATVSPASYNFDETITTLRYANRAKNIKNKPRINEDPKDALLRQFQEEIARLKSDLTRKGGKRKKRKKEKGEEGEEESEGEEEEDEGRFAAEQKAKLEEQKNKIKNDESIIAVERQKMLDKIDEKEREMKKTEEQKKKMESKIKAMESKLLSGGTNILDHTNEQQRELDQRRKLLSEQNKKERLLQQDLETKDEVATELKETFGSLQQEVEVKTKRLKKLFAKLQATKQEIVDVQEEHVKERQELEQTQMELTRELKLKVLIIENFIPPEEKAKVMKRAFFDEDDDNWKLQPLHYVPGSPSDSTAGSALNAGVIKRPVSAAGQRRPVSEYAKVAARGGNPRYKGENILQLELDMPGRTTREYEGPAVAPRVQAALDAALQEEEEDGDLELAGIDDGGGGRKPRLSSTDPIPSVFKHEGRSSSKSKSQKTRSATKTSTDAFPKAKGLAPK